MSNNVRVLYRGVYRSDQSLPALIINTTLIISIQLSSYLLYFILIIYLKSCDHIIGK